MTELEKIERARMYMDKLSAGINPLDNTRIPDGDAARQVRLVRCFAYVSEVLGQVLENGGTTPVREADKPPFTLTREQRDAFVCSETPVSISEIARALNNLNGSRVTRRLTYQMITSWLLEAGILELAVQESGTEGKRPTAEGEALGITVEHRAGTRGMYAVVLYNAAAQRFILDNLDAILAFDQTRLEREGQPWSPEEEARLRELWGEKTPVRRIARNLRRSAGSVRAKMREMGLAGD